MIPPFSSGCNLLRRWNVLFLVGVGTLSFIVGEALPVELRGARDVPS